MNEARLAELMERYFERDLVAAEKAELESLMLASAEARARFWEETEWRALFHQWGEEQSGRAVAARSPLVPLPSRQRPRAAKIPAAAARLRSRFPRVLAWAAMFALLVGGAWIWRQNQPVARVGEMAGVSGSWKRGDALRRGPVKLAGGVAEIVFLNGARVVLEGPADLEITDANALRLRRGRLSANVPPSARGFTVEMPGAKVVDLGTRFGVEAGAVNRVDVFEGKVNVSAAAQSAQLVAGEAVTAFGGDFVRGRADVGRFPQLGGVLADLLKDAWSGSAQVTGAAAGVSPQSGAGMLSFAGAGEAWQALDLRAVREVVVGAAPEAAFTIALNQTANAAGKFTVTLAAFRGAAEQARALRKERKSAALALDEQTLSADGNPATWQRLTARLRVPPGADFLLVHVAASAPKERDITAANSISATGNCELAPDARLERFLGSRSREVKVSGGTILGARVHHVVTYDAAARKWTWYRNGAVLMALADTDGLSTLDDVNNWLGRSQFSKDANFAGAFREFRIYDYALSARQVRANFNIGSDVMAVSRPPRHRWSFVFKPQPAPDGTMIADRVGGAKAVVRGAGAAFGADGLTLPGGSPATQAYVDLPNGVASGTFNGGKRFTSVSYEFWAQQNAHQYWCRLFDFGNGTAGELAGPPGPTLFADSATLEVRAQATVSKRSITP